MCDPWGVSFILFIYLKFLICVLGVCDLLAYELRRAAAELVKHLLHFFNIIGIYCKVLNPSYG